MSDKIFSCLWYDAILDDFKALFLKYKVNSKSPSSNKDSHHEDVTCNIAVCGQLVDIKTLFSIKSQQLNKVVDWDVDFDLVFLTQSEQAHSLSFFGQSLYNLHPHKTKQKSHEFLLHASCSAAGLGS